MVRTFPPIGLLNLTESYKRKSGITSFILHSGCRGFFTIFPLFLYHKPWVLFQSLPSLNFDNTYYHFFITSLKTNSPSYLQMTLIFGLLKQTSGALIGNTPPTMCGILYSSTLLSIKFVSSKVSSTVEHNNKSGLYY